MLSFDSEVCTHLLGEVIIDRSSRFSSSLDLVVGRGKIWSRSCGGVGFGFRSRPRGRRVRLLSKLTLRCEISFKTNHFIEERHGIELPYMSASLFCGLSESCD
jgi:hypothetical protein